jgi:molybdate transport system substrate-binding protein
MTGEPTSITQGKATPHLPPVLFTALALLLVFLLTACTSTPAPEATSTLVSASTTTPAVPLPAAGSGGLTVFAASSLKESFTEAGRQFREDNPMLTDLQYNFQGSQMLVAQLQQGAPADVFASADMANMDKAVQAGVIDGAPQELAHNVLAVVLPNDNPAHIQTLQDLARPGVKLSLADPGVPVGQYSEQALDKLATDPSYGPDFKQKALANVVSREDNVRQVLTRVQLDQVDAGIVYTTDALEANSASSGTVQPVKTIEIPTQYNVIAVYYIATVKGAPHPNAARTWITYLLSDGGQTVLAKYGFVPLGAKR